VSTKKVGIVAALVAAVAVVGIAATFMMNSSGANLLPMFNNKPGSSEPQTTNNTTSVAGSGSAPILELFVLAADQDNSKDTVKYEANNTQPIELGRNQHIRFDSTENRMPDSIIVTARNVDNGNVQLLRKSYDVNNEFFVNLGKGNYKFEVVARWFDVGTHNYEFKVAVT